MLKCFKISVIIAAISVSITAWAQSQEKVYAAMILNFSKGIEWPADVPAEVFTIGIWSYDPLAAEISAMAASMKIHGRRIITKNIQSIDDIKGCQVLFLPAYKARSLGSVLSSLGRDATLLITNKADLARQGSGVNFIFVNGKLRYEINCKSIERRGMKISANIKGMGIVVDD